MYISQFDIPRTYKENHSDYITLPPIKNFIKTHGIKVPSGSTRDELLNSIIQYGQKSPENEEAVQCWIDDTLKEGIKDLYLYYVPASSGSIQSLLNRPPLSKNRRHFVGNQYTGDLSLVNVELQENANGKK